MVGSISSADSREAEYTASTAIATVFEMEENQYYQFSLVNVLMKGVCDTGITSDTLISKGNIGLGTFIRMDGELVLLDGKVYQLRPGGQAVVVSGDAQIPYAACTRFKAQHTTRAVLKDKNALDAALSELEGDNANLFLAYRIEGTFRYLKCRTVRGQEYDGQPLAELGKKQHVEEYHDVKGTVVGFRSPELWQGFAVAGHHMHFIDEQRHRGGHVLEISTDEVEVNMAELSKVQIDLPTSASFRAAQMHTDHEGILSVEG